MSCEVTVPLSGRYSDVLLNTTNPLFSQILSASDIIDLETSPVTPIDRTQLVTLTNSLNHIFKYSTPETLDRFGQLKSKFLQGPISYTDVAAFITGNNIDINEYYDVIVSYSNKLNQTGSTRLASINNVTDGEIVQTGSGNDNLSFLQLLAIPSKILDFLTSFDFSFGVLNYFGLALGFCSIYQSAFGLILTIAGVIDDLVEIISDPEAALAKITYEKLKELALELVDVLIEEVKKILFALLADVIAAANIAYSLYLYIRGRIEAIIKLFSKESVDAIKERISNMFSEASGQFESLTFTNLAHLINRFCEFLDDIVDFFVAPITSLQNVVEESKKEETVVTSKSIENTKRSVENGGLRVSPTIRKETVETPMPPIPRARPLIVDEKASPNPNPNEEILLKQLSSRGIPGVCTFGPGVTESQLDDSNKKIPDVGWERVDKNVWIKLIRLSKACKENGIPSEFIVNSAYRTEKKNKEVGGSPKSLHKSGLAIDIEFANNQPIKLGLGNYSNILNLGKLSSIVGWCGIIFYTLDTKGSFHLDMRPQKLVMVNGTGQVDDSINEKGEKKEGIITLLDRINISYKDDILAFKDQHDNGRVIDGPYLARNAPIPRPRPNVYSPTDASLAIASSTSIA